MPLAAMVAEAVAHLERVAVAAAAVAAAAALAVAAAMDSVVVG